MKIRKDVLAGTTALFVLTACLLFGTVPDLAAVEKIAGQLLYVPVYSNIYSGNIKKPSSLAITVSMRNTDPENAIHFMSVDFYDSKGGLVRQYLTAPIVLGPLTSTRYIVKDSPKTRGAGAKFLIRWRSEAPVNVPLAEGIMISASSQLGISFTSRGVPIGD